MSLKQLIWSIAEAALKGVRDGLAILGAFVLVMLLLQKGCA